MNEMYDYYATPEAELGVDDAQLAGFDGTAQGPTEFGDTLAEMVRLFPKVIWGLTGYTLLWIVLYFVSVIALSIVAGIAGAAAAGVGFVVVMVVGMAFVLALWAFFWTATFRRLDNVYRRGTKGGEFGFAFAKTLPVMGSFFLKGMVMLPFLGAAWLVMITMMDSVIDSMGGFLGLMAIFFLLQVAGWIAYSFVHFADMAVICEDAGAISGLNRAFEVVKGFRNWFYMVGLFIVVMMAMWMISTAAYCLLMIPMGLLVGAGTELFGPEAGLVGLMITYGLSLLVWLLMIPAFAVANYMAYQSLVARWQIGREPTW